MVLAGMAHGACEDHCSNQDDDDRAIWAAAPGAPEDES